MPSGFEPFHDLLALPCRQMGILRSIIEPLVLAMLEIHVHSRASRAIGLEFVRDHDARRAGLLANELTQKHFSGALVAAALNQSVEDKAGRRQLAERVSR